jgi:hypothetical protein
MSTDPVSQQALQLPAQPQQPPPRTRTAVVPGPSLSALGGATLTLLLGGLLGIANQAASGTSMSLRFPALLAALLMVGQGVISFQRGLVSKPTVERVPEDEPAMLTRELPVSKMRPVRNVSALPPVRVTPATLAVPITVMVLAAWLGLADLTTQAPSSLSVLSLIAAFALFALGWSLLPNRH